MPRHVRSPGTHQGKYSELVSELASELVNPSDVVQPIILEDETPETNTLRIQVIWQKWINVPYEHRTAVILDAYEAAFGTERRSRVMLALGFSFGEARRVGLLPFAVRPTSQLDLDSYAKLVSDLKSLKQLDVPLEFPNEGPILWVATLEDAEKAKDVLEQKLPGSKWIIVEEQIRDAW